MTPGTLTFGDVALDLAGHEIRRDGAVVPVEPQVFEVLAYLVEHRDRLVPKTELLDEVWGDRFVSESALTSRIKSARRAVGDNGRDQRVIRTVHGRGYRFVAPVDDGPGADPGAGGGLAAVVPALRAGRGRAVVMVAPAGPLRTEALDDVYEDALAAGVLAARSSAAAVRPYALVAHLLDELLQRRPEVIDQVPAGCRAELVAVLDGKHPSSPGRIQLAVREAVLAAADPDGLVLVLEDLEFADRPSMVVVDQLARLTRRHPLAVLCAHPQPDAIGAEVEVIELPARREVPTDRFVPALPADVVEALTRVALGGPAFDLAEFRAASGWGAEASDRALDVALSAGAVEPLSDGYRFAVPEEATRLVDGLAPHRRAAIRRQTAEALAEAGAAPGRVADLLVAAGEPAAAVPYELEAVRRASALHLHAEVLTRVDAVVDDAVADERVELLAHRGAAMVATGDPGAARVYREALRDADAGWATPLRAGLAQASILAGDLPGAEEAIAGVELDGSPFDGGVLLARGMVAFFRGDLDDAEDAARDALALALAPGAPNRLLDVITLQGMIAHNRGEWFDRLRRELRTTNDNPELASTIFDCHLCVAEYLLYGPLPYAEVVALARDLEATAVQSGARRAEAFARCVAGEALLLGGRLDEARVDLERSIELHRDLHADTGTAHSLQRLAELELAEGNRAEAERVAREALPLARWSPLARHLVQRTYGTLIASAPDAATAASVADEAHAAIDEPSRCEYCDVMVAAPASAAYAVVGRLDEARDELTRARRSAALWHGSAWPAAVAETEAVLARTEGRAEDADDLLGRAADLFAQAGQPLDAARCREAIEA